MVEFLKLFSEIYLTDGVGETGEISNVKHQILNLRLNIFWNSIHNQKTWSTVMVLCSLMLNI